jgi:serine/threonine-protein kinase
MPSDPQVFGLLEEMLDSGKTPEEACREHPELLPEVRQRWREFLRIDAEVGALLPGIRTRPAAETVPGGRLVGELPHLPGYEVEVVLGHGGMGVVYKARQCALDRLVAVKMLLAGPLAGPQELERFHRETAALARLRHPNIVQVYDAGEVEGRPYFSMELVEGGSLAQKLSGTPQPARQAAALLTTLAEAIHAAHQSGILHRDLKPANILLAADGTPKIADFGLAAPLEGGAGLTQSGVPVGTPSYMAPEQARGETRAIGPAVDVYALGAILYELLTGRPPFRAETAAQTLRQVVDQEPAPPSRLNAVVPRDLETICLKCLHKAPARRYAGARELADDLGRFMAGTPIQARRVGVAERAAKWTRRRPAVALLLAALAVMAGSAAGVGLWLRHQEADRRAAKARQEAEAREAIETALSRADDRRREERWPEALLILTEAETHLAEADSPPLEQRLRQAQSDVRIAADLERVRESSPLQSDGDVDYQQRAAEYREVFARAGLRTDDDPGAVADFIRTSAIRDQLIAAVEDRALVAYMLGDDPLLGRLLEVARSVDPEPRWENRFRQLAAWRNRGQLEQLAADAFKTSPAPPAHQLALLGCLLRHSGPESSGIQLLGEACRRQPGNFWLNREMGNTLLKAGHTGDSLAYYRAALALRPDNAGVHEGLGNALFSAGQNDEALAVFRRAVELPPRSRSSRQRLVSALARSGRWVEAADECRRSLKVDPTDPLPPLRLGIALYGDGRHEGATAACREATEADPNAAAAHYYLGLALMPLGRHEEAITAFRKVTELWPNNGNARDLLAQELAAVGRPGEAIAEFRTAIDRNPTNDVCYRDLGTLLRKQGQPAAAAAAFRKAADLHPQHPESWDGLAAALLDQGHFAEARAAAARPLDLPAAEAARRARRRQLDLCDALLPVEAHIPAALAGEWRPENASTRLALAEWCLTHRRLTATAAGLYEASLAAEPSLADDLEAGHRSHAARAAALAACGVGEDATKLDDRRRETLRRQALGWLTAEYNAWAERHRLGKPGDRTAAATAVRSWQREDDLAGVRDKPALARLPRDERPAWQALWADVAALAARDPAALFDGARVHVGRREWKEAVAAYAEGFELGPTDDSELWFEYAAVQLLADDRAGYRRACAHMLARCQPAGPMRPYLVARACTLARDSTDNPALPGRLAQDELMRSPTAFWSLTEQAALQFRGSATENVVLLFERSLVADGRPGRAVLNWLWLALAHQQGGNAAEARLWLDRAARWLDQQGGRMPRDTRDLGLHRHAWLEAHVLRKEAAGLLPAAD